MILMPCWILYPRPAVYGLSPYFFSYLPSQKEIHGEGQTRECNFDESPVLKGFGTSHVSCASEASIGLGIL